ncbi:membrane protein [Burkholderia pseudomallei]|nr:membrane protein [Burkholderia pseudomallei]
MAGFQAKAHARCCSRIPRRPTPRTHRAFTGSSRLARPRPTARRPPADTLAPLLEAARTQTAAAEIAPAGCGLVSDADQRGGSRTEIAAVAERNWPDDARERCRHLGVANGESGAALALGAIAIAGWRASEEQMPMLAASIADPVARGVMLVAPAPIAPVTASELAAAA